MNTPRIIIRPAVANDTSVILGFIRALADYEKLAHACIATEALLQEHLFGPHPAAEVLIAELRSDFTAPQAGSEVLRRPGSDGENSGSPDYLRTGFSNSAGTVLKSSLNANPAGFALFFGTFSTFLAKPGIYLEDLFVIPEARGQGVGKALLTALAQIAVQRRCGRLEWAVLDWNDPAIGFYKKLGAVALDDWTTFRLTGDTLERLARKQGKI